jgi:PleD family two-component response regulator
LTRLRQDGRLKHLAVIVLTSSDEERDQAEAVKLGLGANLYFRKPADFDGYVGMAETIRRLISHNEEDNLRLSISRRPPP